MSDWTDEVRARMVREEERLRYKAANLQARGKTVMAAQELVVADDIRAALGEIGRQRSEIAALARQVTEAMARSERDHIRDEDRLAEWKKRAEAAEVEVERLRESASRHVCESHTGCADLLAAAKTAEIERLLCIISPGDAAAFEEHMAAREAHWVAQVERLREALTGSERVLRGWAVSAPKGGSLTYELEADILRAALRGGGE